MRKNPAQVICDALGGDTKPQAIMQTQKILDALYENNWAFVDEIEQGRIRNENR